MRFPPRLVLAVVAALVAAAPASAARRPAAKPERSNVGASPFARIHDRVFTRDSRGAKRLARASRKGYGGAYRARDGTPVHVYTSPYYQPDDSVNQSWADFFGDLVHGGELRKVIVYIAPESEMAQLCGEDNDACYTDDDNRLVTLGDQPADGASLEDLAAHEYGHHVANHRLNDVGRPQDYGPEYWATYERVCIRDGHTMFPGNEGRRYKRNPGEGWAETYRALNVGIEPWDTVSEIFYPTKRSLKLARLDVVNPYDGGEYIDLRGRLSSKRRWRKFRVPVENDGNVRLRLHSRGSLNGDLYVFARKRSRRPLDRTRRNRLDGIYCGYRHLYVAVKRARGHGSFRLRATLPFFTTSG